MAAETNSSSLDEPIELALAEELGLLPQDFSINCHNNKDAICPGKFSMVTTAVEGITNRDVDDGTAEEVRSSLSMRICGYDFLAETVVCTVDGPCEVREVVRDSVALQMTMKGAKALHSGLFGLKRRLKG